MGSERLYTLEAVIIRRRDQGEADRVLTLCTPAGKLTVIAKGVRKIRSRKAGHLELFACSRLTLARSRSSWDVISQADTVEPHPCLRDNLVQGTYARYVTELYDRFVAEGEGGPALFDLVGRTLDYLCQVETGAQEPATVRNLLMRAYEQRLLALVGFRAEWNRCVGERDGRLCGRPLEGRGDALLGLDPERGGALCAECFGAGGGRWAVALSVPAWALLRACAREPFALLRQRAVSPPLLAEAERAMRRYIAYHLEQDVRSGTFLRRLKQELGEGPI